MTKDEAVKLLREKQTFTTDELAGVIVLIKQQAKALEEAAKAAEGVFPRGSAHTYASENADVYIAQELTCGLVAGRIRALNGE